MEAFREKFRLDELTLRRYEHWTVSVHPAQPTLGALVVSLHRPCEHLGAMEPAETEELAQVFRDVEAALDEAYAPNRVNYLALMMVDAQVHFHVLPRYAEPRTVGDRTVEDPAWPGPPALGPLGLSPEELAAVGSALRPVLGG